ncbi:hypothetical protein [Methyloversatilis sp.]|uniref:hypothetical protein n=1 Tax=Methyloversatilis sp. TaxID=2569862 RepID=UPI003D2A9119
MIINGLGYLIFRRFRRGVDPNRTSNRNLVQKGEYKGDVAIDTTEFTSPAQKTFNIATQTASLDQHSISPAIEERA